MCLRCFPPPRCCHTGRLFTPSPPLCPHLASMSTTCLRPFHVVDFFFPFSVSPPQPAHTFCHSAAFCFLFTLSSLFFLGLICRKVKDTLPLFRQFFSSAFSLTYVSLASMKLPPDVLRCFLFFAPFHLSYNVAPQLRL